MSAPAARNLKKACDDIKVAKLRLDERREQSYTKIDSKFKKSAKAKAKPKAINRWKPPPSPNAELLQKYLVDNGPKEIKFDVDEYNGRVRVISQLDMRAVPKEDGC